MLADRYAVALLDVAWEHNEAEQVKASLDGFAALVAESRDLRLFLATPAVPVEAKRTILKELLDRLGSSATMQNFLNVVVDRRRAAMLPEIAEAYAQKLNVKLGVAEAAITSAADLSAQEKTELTEGLAHTTGLKIVARYAVDPALLGGASVRIGDMIYDGSVREQLRRLAAEMAAE
jgi:F-type H+-transporting ATPase subunit delta